MVGATYIRGVAVTYSTKRHRKYTYASSFVVISTCLACILQVYFTGTGAVKWFRADSRFAPCQWETSLHCNDVSHCLGANLESALWLLQCQPRYTKIWVNVLHESTETIEWTATKQTTTKPCAYFMWFMVFEPTSAGPGYVRNLNLFTAVPVDFLTFIMIGHRQAHGWVHGWDMFSSKWLWFSWFLITV